MKDRILENLLAIALMDEAKEAQGMLSTLMLETGLDQSTLQKRGKERLQDILKNYASFHIKTIDSFTNKLIKSFAFDLDLTADFEVELDTELLMKEAVDGVLAKIGIDKELTTLLVSFSKAKTLEDKSWDISRDLQSISKLILNENHASGLKDLSEKSLSSFTILSKKLREDQKTYKQTLKDIGTTALELIQAAGVEHKEFYSSQLPKFFIKISSSPEDSSFKKDSSIYRNVEDRVLYSKSKPESTRFAIDRMADRLIQFYKQAFSVYEKIKLNELILKNLEPLAVINAINIELNEIKAKNNVRLNAEFNQLISEHLIAEPAAFIYEKLGERFKYFFIDEMQDTSRLQWQNLIPLIDNAISTADSGLMLVGDAKQAIYRWRGGQAEQFISLSSGIDDGRSNPFQIKKALQNLETNYRSHEEVINFNNVFFSYISRHFSSSVYQELYRIGNAQNTNNKKGGFVQLQFVAPIKTAQLRDEVYPEKVYETIKSLNDQFDLNEICVLVRKKKEGTAIAKYLTEQGLDIVSSETLLIKNNERVDFMINLLKMLHDDTNEEAKFDVLNFLHKHLSVKSEKHAFFKEMIPCESSEIFSKLENYGVFYEIGRFNNTPVFEAIEDIIRSFRLISTADAFMQFFLDFVFDYTQRRSNKTSSFLDYYEEKKDKLTIVSAENMKAVRIMTIHKSKGLEFPVVIYPYNMDLYNDRNAKAWYQDLDRKRFNDFDSLLIDSSSGIKITGEYGTFLYEQQRSEMQLDSFNLLYVCLTRAVEQLYVISEIKKPNGLPTTSSHLFYDFLSAQGLWQEDQMTYDFGDPRRRGLRNSQNTDTAIQKDFISSSWQDHQIHIITNSELLWDTKRTEAIGYGNMIHEILSCITSKDDVETALEGFIIKGLLSREETSEIKELLLRVIMHPLLSPYFEPNVAVLNEREILTASGQLVIPDRLIFDGNKVTIVDYKTGKPDASHQLQIDHYAVVLEKMNFVIHEKLIVYIDKDISVIKS